MNGPSARPLRPSLRLAASFLLLCLPALGTGAEPVQVAVAANFAAPMERIAADFEKETGHAVKTAVGATGMFYAQIRNGAPFEILLAADAATPRRLEDEGLAVAGQRFTYATGRLVLYSAQPGRVDDQGRVLKEGRFQRLALANPKTAPYGAAAVEVLQALGLWEAAQGRIVQGESIGQAFEFTASGNAELGFVALSQLHAPGAPSGGSSWIVPQELYRPIRQDAVLLNRGKDDAVARALLDYLRSEKVRELIRSYGYEL